METCTKNTKKRLIERTTYQVNDYMLYSMTVWDIITSSYHTRIYNMYTMCMYIYMVAPPKKTYVFYKNTAIYSVSRTFWPLDFGSFFGGHHMYNINKIHDM